MILTIVAIAIFLFFVFRLINYIKSKLPLTSRFRHFLFYVLPIAELLSWIGLVLWFFAEVYSSGNNFMLIAVSVLLVIFTIPSIALLKDFIVGINLKSQNKINEGDYIDLEDVKGNIIRAGHFRLDVVDKQGDANSISYSAIRSHVIKSQSTHQRLTKVKLSFSFEESENINDIVSDLRLQILNTAWVAAGYEPIVEIEKIENGKVDLKADIFTISESYAENIKKMLVKYFGL
ncbi:hypothetical protein [Saccharicrinis sp. 156]|uniref:hypothetical protein n=1 Tax=Saccharicrinis sp. 156 TaxID=3417574 RepID=UPI003D357784